MIKQIIILETLFILIIFSLCIYSYVSIMSKTIKHEQKIIQYDCKTDVQQCQKFKAKVDQLESSQQSYLIILIIAIILSIITLLLSFSNIVYKFKSNFKKNNSEQIQSKQKNMQSYYFKLLVYFYRAILVLNIIFIQIGFIGLIVSKKNFQNKIQLMTAQYQKVSRQYIKKFQNNLKPFYALQAFLILALVTNLLIHLCSKQKDKIQRSKKYRSKNNINQTLQKLQFNNISDMKIKQKSDHKQIAQQISYVQQYKLNKSKQNPYTSSEFKLKPIHSQRHNCSFNQQKNHSFHNQILTPVSLKQKNKIIKSQQKQQSKNTISSQMLYTIFKKKQKKTKYNHD